MFILSAFGEFNKYSGRTRAASAPLTICGSLLPPTVSSVTWCMNTTVLSRCHVTAIVRWVEGASGWGAGALPVCPPDRHADHERGRAPNTWQTPAGIR